MFPTLVSIFVFLVTVDISDACLPSGVCGVNPMCGPMGNPLGSALLPPPPIMNPIGGMNPIGMNPIGGCPRMGCGSGMSCGPYGCFRVRAHASKSRGVRYANSTENLRPTEWADLEAASPSVAAYRRSSKPTVNPDRVFYECCLDRKLPDSCLSKCRFGLFRREMLIEMYLKKDDCPIEAMREMQFCAAQGRDHSKCCQRNGIATTLSGNKCLQLCDQRPGRVIQLDMSYLPCFERFNEMVSCYRNDFNQRKA